MSKNYITVLMPVKNGMPYLIEAVDSILEQSYSNFELLIIDDSSSDGSIDYINSIGDPRIRIIKNYGEGIADALNTGIQVNYSKYTAIMDADDISDVNRIESQLNYLEENSDCILVGTSIEYFTHSKHSKYWKVKMPFPDDIIKEGFNKGIYVLSHPTIMVRTSFIKQISGYRRDSFPNIDIDLFKRLYPYGKFSNLSNIFTAIRLHDRSFTHNNLYQIVKQNYLFKHDKKSVNTFYDKLFVNLKYLSIYNYKKGINLFLNGKKIVWIIFLLYSAFLDIPKTLFYIKNKYAR
jgi:glycosyltransferase involved in cell wall biosynthesis